MKLTLFIACCLVLGSCSRKSQKTVELKSKVDSVSYTLGINIGKEMRKQSIESNIDIVAQGIRDGLTDDKRMLSDDQMQRVMNTLQEDLTAKEHARVTGMRELNRKEGETFLAENGKKPGVKTTASGLQYKVVKEGAGKTPGPDDNAVVHYRGTLINGKEFDNSYKRGQPVTFPIKGVIPGWTEALQLMKAGSKWQLFVPSKLAYGERGAGNDIGPDATLIFEVELLEVPGK